MYLDYWKLNSKPFENTPDPDFYYFAQKYEEAYIRFKHAIVENRGALLLTGEFGCGKTTLVRLLVDELPTESCKLSIINHPRGDIHELLTLLLKDMTNDNEATLDTSSLEAVFRQVKDILLDNYRSGFHTLLIIDEAQLLDNSVILDLIKISGTLKVDDTRLLNLFLVGHPDLKERISAKQELSQRFHCKCHLKNLDSDETAQYIIHRLLISGSKQAIFTEQAVEKIWHHSEGIPRRINNHCDLLLLIGCYRKAKAIGSDIVRLLLN